jgi:cell wall-associated NlpC family hydrolase
MSAMSLRACAVALLAAGLATACGSGRAQPRPFPGGPTSTPSAPSASPVAAVPAIVATALTLRGAPYRNGGSAPSGFDCSGFVQYVFAQHGRALPREVKDQFRLGQEVGRQDVRPGDLVFFQTVSPGASHVGIALAGDEFVHAPSSRGVVRVEKYTSQYWAARWKGARRLVGP